MMFYRSCRATAFVAAALAFFSAFPTAGRSEASAPEARPSFDCAKAGTAVEKAICGSPALAMQDRELAASYSAVREDLKRRGDDETADALLQTQRHWIKRRDACKKHQGDARQACIARAYHQRQGQIARLLEKGRGLAPISGVYIVQNLGRDGDLSLIAGVDGRYRVAISTVNPRNTHLCDLAFQVERDASGRLIWADPDPVEGPRCKVVVTPEDRMKVHVHSRDCQAYCGAGVSINGSYRLVF